MNLNFTFLRTGLSVRFIAILTGDPVSLLWDFGDGTTQEIDLTDPSLEDPHIIEKTYSFPYYYNVSLSATWEIEGQDNEVITKTYEIAVSEVEFTLSNKPINELVLNFMPPGIDVQSILPQLPDLIFKWQLFLAVLVDFEIEENNINNELYWPALHNYLIAQLCTYDIILSLAQRYLVNMGIQDSTQAGLEIKSIKTGPAEAEWFQGSETWSEIFKNEGFFDRLIEQICNLSHRLRVTLEICRNLDHNTKVPSVHRKPKKIKNNPFNKNRL